MAKKDFNNNKNGHHNGESKNGGLKIGEIGTIRNILMGEQISEYELKFRELEAHLNDLKSELFARVQETNKHNQLLVSSLEKNLENNLLLINNKQELQEQKNKALEENVKEQLKESSEENQKIMGQLLIDLGTKLLNK